jgi:hypothetical protein
LDESLFVVGGGSMEIDHGLGEFFIGWNVFRQKNGLAIVGIPGRNKKRPMTTAGRALFRC